MLPSQPVGKCLACSFCGNLVASYVRSQNRAKMTLALPLGLFVWASLVSPGLLSLKPYIHTAII